MDSSAKTPAGMPNEPAGSTRQRAGKWDERRQAFAKGDPLRVVFITAPEAEAEKLARTLLEERHVACANLIKGVRSLYWWKDKIEDSAETLLMLKTTASKINGLIRRARELHSYEVPEVLALSIMESNPAYATWVAGETGKATE